MTEQEVKVFVSQQIQNAPLGGKVLFEFSGVVVPIKIDFLFQGGWEVSYVIPPGQRAELTRGADGYLNDFNITLLNYDGMREAE